MAKKIRLTDEQKVENNQNIEKIKTLTEQIKTIVVSLHGRACSEAYQNSVSNLETKNEKFMTKETFPISDEEKELIRKIRAGEITLPIAPQNPDEPVTTVSEENVEAESTGKKRRH